MLALQIISALLLLLNKYYVRKKKTIGWSLGIWGTVSITIYFYLQMVLQNKGNLWIMIVYDIALICLMIYGYLLSSSKNNKLSNLLRKWNVVFKFVVSFVTIVVCVFLLIQAVSANLIVIQFLSAIGGLVGTLLLAFNTKSTNKIGWVVYFFTHLIVVYLMIETDSVFIAICQVFSAWVAVLGFRDELKKSI
ncbi:MAG TPA: nicotinamide mononucleotide transporter [Candidatus Paceibacterota bacterium]|nr:nicotinamide mononucleotide transporter [Candidatus Paceibacterota bacterium]